MAVVAGLGIAVWVYKLKAEAAEARVEAVIGQRDRAIAAARANEEAALRFKALNDALSEAVAERDKRAKALEETKRKLKGELDAIRATLPEEDKSCLSRPLPPALDLRLRDGPGGDANPGGSAASPGRTANPVQ